MHNILLLMSLLWSCAALAQMESYELSPGDSISIYVFDEPELSLDGVLIGQTGSITYPLLGDLSIEGMTLPEVQSLLSKQLKPDYLIDPRISITIARYRPFFVNGEVKKPGEVEFQPDMTLRKAVTLSGGFTERANRKKFYVMSNSVSGREEREVGIDYAISPGDIVTIRDTFF